jgi:hypothetical protein
MDVAREEHRRARGAGLRTPAMTIGDGCGRGREIGIRAALWQPLRLTRGL